MRNTKLDLDINRLGISSHHILSRFDHLTSRQTLAAKEPAGEANVGLREQSDMQPYSHTLYTFTLSTSS